MLKKTLVAAVCASAAALASAHQGNVPNSTFGHLDHVFLIMMENHSAAEIIGSSNPATPFLNAYARQANLAANYWAVGHPSLTNYLEVVGGSNFGVIDDYWPDWTNGGCVDHNPSGSGCGGAVRPISGVGLDYGFPATVDACQQPWFAQLGPLPQCATAGNGSAVVANNWGIVDYSTPQTYTARTIAHQLAAEGRTWRSYQQSAADRLAGGRRQLLGRQFLQPEPGFCLADRGEERNGPEPVCGQAQPFCLLRGCSDR